MFWIGNRKELDELLNELLDAAMDDTDKDGKHSTHKYN